MTTNPQTSSQTFRYFISFAHSDGVNSGFGNAVIARTSPVLTSDDFREIEQWLTSQGLMRVTLMHFALLPAPTTTGNQR
jgi:hypothetical protein